MSQSRADRIAAIESLLPLLEAHNNYPVTARAQWVSAPEAARPPAQPEPDCRGRCLVCSDHQTRRCTLRELHWAAEWKRLRAAYPQLHTLEILLNRLGQEYPRWAAAIYRVYIPPWDWDAWDQEHERALARLGVEWLETRFVGWVPTHGEAATEPRPDKRAEIVRLRSEGASYHAIAQAMSCSKSTVRAALTGTVVRRGRAMYAQRVDIPG